MDKSWLVGLDSNPIHDGRHFCVQTSSLYVHDILLLLSVYFLGKQEL